MLRKALFNEKSFVSPKKSIENHTVKSTPFCGNRQLLGRFPRHFVEFAVARFAKMTALRPSFCQSCEGNVVPFEPQLVAVAPTL